MNKKESFKKQANPNELGSNKDYSSLGKLYPRPKSYDEIAKDDEMRSKNYANRLPKLWHLKVSLSGGLLVGIFALFIFNLKNLWLSGNIALIFFSFFATLILFGLFYIWIKYTNSLFYSSAKSSTVFWLLLPLLLIIGLLTAVNIFKENTLGICIALTSIFIVGSYTIQKIILR